MTKRILTLAMTLLTTLTVCADDVTTINSKTLWTFVKYPASGGQSEKVINYTNGGTEGTGIFIHSKETDSSTDSSIKEYVDFGTNSGRAASTSGTFSNGESWSSSSILTCKRGVESGFTTLGNITTTNTTNAANSSLAFSHSVAGRLYVIYGNTATSNGTFYINLKKGGESSFSSIYSETMSARSSADGWKYTQIEAVVDLPIGTGNGTVYMGGTTAYCIYAILFVPTYTIKALAGAGGSVSSVLNGTTNITTDATGENGAICEKETSVTFTATPNTGYHFVNWTNANSEIVSTDAEYTISSLTADQTLTANFAADKTAPTYTAPTYSQLTYNGSSQNLITAGSSDDGTFTYSTLEDGTYSESIPQGTDAGDYTVWYKLTGDATHTDIGATEITGVSIAKYNIENATGATAIEDQTATGSQITPAAPAIKMGETTIDAENYDVSYGTNTEVGTGSITYTAKSESTNFTGTKTLTFNITSGTLSVTAENHEGAYDGAAHGITVTCEGATIKYRTSDSGEYNLTENPTYTNAGTYTVYYQVTKSGYTDVEGNKTVTINPVTLTATADNKSKTAGEANPEFTVTVTGFVNDETAGTAAGYVAPTATCEATTSSEAGSYDIVPSGGSATNYTFNYVNGTLTVTAPATYEVSKTGDNSENIAFDKANPSAGETVTITVSIPDNKKISGGKPTVYKADDTSTTIDVANGSQSNQFTFTMPAYAVTVSVEFEDLPDVYGTYDFQTWAGGHVSGDGMSLIVLDANGYMTGGFTPQDEGVTITGSMPLNYVFSISETSANTYKLRKNSSAANTGLLTNKAANASITINRLQAGDWFTIATNYSDHLAFAADNVKVKKAGSSTTVTKDTFVEPGVTYVVTGATNVALYNNTQGNTYIYSVTISNTEVVSPPTISADNGQVTIAGGASTADQNVTTYYTIDGSTPTAESTTYSEAITISETRLVKAVSISESGVASSVTTLKVVVDGATPMMVWDFVNDEQLNPLAWGDDHLTMSYYTTANKDNADFRYLTNAPIHARMAWQSDGNNTENASTAAGNGLKVTADSRAFTINDLAVGDAIYITYTTTGDALKTSKHTTRGNTVTIGETAVTEGQTEVPSGAKLVVTAVDETNNYVAFMPNKGITITQILINPVYKITATSEHGTIAATSPEGVDLSTDTFTPSTEVVLEVTPTSDEWTFSHWVVNGQQESSATLTLTMDCDKTVEAVFSQVVSATGVPVIIVAGQSNTDGRIKTSETAFPYTLNHTQISYCNGDVNGSYPVVDEGNFVTYGTTPRSDAGECWGYDAIIYNNIQTLLGGETDFYVIKQSKGNTAVNAMSTSGNNQHWWSANPVWLDRNTSANQGGRSLLKALKDNIDKSLKTLEDAGKEYDIKFLMWHQGEADRDKGAEYEIQLKAVIGEVRNYLVERTGNNKYSDLPVILGGIANVSGEYKAEVEAGKQALAAADAKIYYAPTGTLTLDEDFRSDKVHFNATGAEKLATSVWDIVTTNNLMNGITLAGDDTPVVNPLAEDVVSETTTWKFTAAGALTENQSQNGLYNHRGTVNQKNYGTITLSDGSELDGTYAATTNGADRKSVATQGLTAGYTGLTYVYSVNVDCEGTFIAVLRPLSIKDANTQQYARLMLNGEELQSVAITSIDEHVQLVGKTTGEGTFTVFCGESWDFIGAKFIKGATSIEIMTAPTIEAGSGLNKVKINPGTSDQSDATIKTYYTTDGSTPTAESDEYTGIELTLTQDCTVKAVSISSKGSVVYSEGYSFTYEQPTTPTTWDFAQLYKDNNEFDLGISSTNSTVYYYKRTDDTTGQDASGNFYALTASPVSSAISWREKNVQLTANGLQPTKGDRPFAIHGLKVGDQVSMEFTGDIYYAKHSSHGSALEGMTSGEYITRRTVYTVSEQDASNDYVVFYPTQSTYISQIAINQEIIPLPEQPTISYKENKSSKAVYTITSADGNNIAYQINGGAEVTTTGTSVEVSVSNSSTLKAWAYNSQSGQKSNEVSANLLETPIVEKNGVFDFSNIGLSNNVKFAVDESSVALTNNEVSFYQPAIHLAATFAGKMLFKKPASGNTAVRNDQLHINTAEKPTYYLAISVQADKYLTITESAGKAKMYIGESELTSGVAHKVAAGELTNGYLIVRIDGLADGSASIKKIIIADNQEVVTAPVITLKDAKTITIAAGTSSATNTVTTYYTTDGTEPNANTETYFTGASKSVTMTDDCTVKAISVSSGDGHPQSTTTTVDFVKQKEEDAGDKEAVQELVSVVDENNAKVSSVIIGEDATTVTISGTVSNGTSDAIPVTAIADNTFTAANTANVAAIDLSETQVDIAGSREEIPALKNINEATLIYLPETANVTGTNVVTKSAADSYSCDDYQLMDGKTASVPHAFTATNAKINREFTVDRKCTVCLPYAITATGGAFYEFTGISNGKVQMTAKAENATLSANTPYIFVPSTDATALSATNVEVSISDAPETENEEAKFTFVGTFGKIEWDAPEGIYGFAAEEQGSVSAGQFVRVGSGASIAAYRAYLKYDGAGKLSSVSRRSGENLPETLEIEWLPAPASSTTSIHDIQLSTDDEAPVYNMSGQRVDKSYKGLVIKNGKKVVRK